MTDQKPIAVNEKGAVIHLYIQPKSSKNEAIGLYNNSFKLKIKAPPVDGAANKECVKFLSKALKISKSSISILSGETGRQKKIFINKPSNQTVKEFEKSLLNFFTEKV